MLDLSQVTEIKTGLFPEKVVKKEVPKPAQLGSLTEHKIEVGSLNFFHFQGFLEIQVENSALPIGVKPALLLPVKITQICHRHTTEPEPFETPGR